jgi:hypothetical protein
MVRPIFLACAAVFAACSALVFVDACRAWRCPQLRRIAAVDLVMAAVCMTTAAFMVVTVSLAR